MWGDVAYDRYAASRHATSARRRFAGVVFVIFFVGVSLVWVRMMRDGDPSRFASVSTPTVATPGVISTTTVPRTDPTRPNTTGVIAALGPTVGAATAPPLANTGTHDSSVLAVAAIVIATGIALGASRRGRR